MKYINTGNNVWILLLFIATTCYSCTKSFLDIEPKGRLIPKKTLEYQAMLSNVDIYLVTLGATPAQVVMGDETAAVDPFFSTSDVRTQRLFRWDDIVYEPGEDASEFAGFMKHIYYFNKVVNEVMHSIGTDQEKKSVLAQARATRAWTYFQLINYYGKPYNPSTASTDPGFPIITEADATATKFSRASVQQVYDFILEDLKAAIPELPVEISHRLKMAKSTAEGILGKVYMFMGKFDEALPLLNASISGMTAGPLVVRLYDYKVTLATGGSFLPITNRGPVYPNYLDNTEYIFARLFNNSYTLSGNDILASPATMNLYESSDLRMKFFTSTPYPSGSPYPAVLKKKITSSTTQMGVLVSDLYLLRAECKARLNDLDGASADVKTLRENRMTGGADVPANIAADQVALVKFILEERIREFALMGYRWFDMRRLSVDPIYSNTISYSHHVYDAAGNIRSTYTLRPARLTMQFPQKLMDQNPGMENNP